MKNSYIRLNSWIEKYLDKYRLTYPIAFMLFLIFCTMLLLKIGGGITFINTYVFYLLEFILLFLSTDLLLYRAIKTEKIEYIYLSLMIPIGLCYMIFIIPNYPYDEAAHAYRVYELSNGKFITKSNDEKKAIMKVPQQLIDTMEIKNYKQLVNNLTLTPDYKNLVELHPDATGAAPYTIFSYFSPTIGMLIGKTMNLNVLLTYYLARLMSFISFLVITFYAIKIIPFGKIILFIISFNPIWIQQGVSISADTMINAFTLLLLSFVFYLYDKKEKITNKEINIYGILAIFISFMKMVYFPLSALGLLLFNKIKNKKQRRKILIIIILTLIFAFLNYAISNFYTFPKSYQLEHGINSIGQIKWILSHPIGYLKVIINTTITNGEFYFYTMMGRNLGNYTIVVPGIAILIYGYICLLSPLLEEKKEQFNTQQKVIITMVIITIYILIETAMYVIWTGIGANIVDGVQGRYFHPILLLLPFIFIGNNKIKLKNKNLKLTILLLSVNIVALYSIIKYFNY